MLRRRGRYTISLKFLILVAGIICAATVISGGKEQLAVPLSIICAGCLVAFALLENNDVKEANKE